VSVVYVVETQPYDSRERTALRAFSTREAAEEWVRLSRPLDPSSDFYVSDLPFGFEDERYDTRSD